VTLKPELGSVNVIGTDTYRSATDDFLLTFRNKHGPISYRFRDRRRFQSKIAKFSHSADGVPLGIGYRRSESEKNKNDGATGLRKKFDDIQCTNVTDGRTDRHRATAKTALTHSIAR